MRLVHILHGGLVSKNLPEYGEIAFREKLTAISLEAFRTIEFEAARSEMLRAGLRANNVCD